MATTPNTSGRFIGRIGVLAIALGIGAAITNSPGLALAEDNSSTASADGAATTDFVGPPPNGSASNTTADSPDTAADDEPVDDKEPDA